MASSSSAPSNPWPNQIDLGIRNRASGLDFCLKKLLDEKLTEVTVLTAAERARNDSPAARAQGAQINILRRDLENVKRNLIKILARYRDAGCKKEDEGDVISNLKVLILHVYETKCRVDLAFRNLMTNIKGGGHGDEKGKGLMISDKKHDVNRSYYRDILGLSSSSSEVESEAESVDSKQLDKRKHHDDVMKNHYYDILGFSSSSSEAESEADQSNCRDSKERLLGKLQAPEGAAFSSGDDLGRKPGFDSAPEAVSSTKGEGLNQEMKDLATDTRGGDDEKGKGLTINEGDAADGSERCRLFERVFRERKSAAGYSLLGYNSVKNSHMRSCNWRNHHG